VSRLLLFKSFRIDGERLKVISSAHDPWVAKKTLLLAGKVVGTRQGWGGEDSPVLKFHFWIFLDSKEGR
jgi:hypothetical protein